MEHIVGAYKTRLFKIWDNMRQRCKNKNTDAFEYYGGRGISVCDEWDKSFDAFYQWAIDNGYGEKLTIDRINVNGNYTPDNCKWSTIKEQNNNRRNNRVLCFNGVSKTVTEWAEEVGIDARTISHRILRDGWTIENALTVTPKRGNRIKKTQEVEHETD